jgi:hypothetical protein
MVVSTAVGATGSTFGAGARFAGAFLTGGFEPLGATFPAGLGATATLVAGTIFLTVIFFAGAGDLTDLVLFFMAKKESETTEAYPPGSSPTRASAKPTGKLAEFFASVTFLF